MNPEEFATLILAILGVLLQLAFKYAPTFSTWYQNHANKGTLALVFAAAIGVIYVALACTPFAVDLGIAVSCDKSSIFTLLKSIFIIANAQQLAYLFGKNKPAVAG